MRERVAIVFMTLNVMATLALGGAIAYDFSHRRRHGARRGRSRRTVLYIRSEQRLGHARRRAAAARHPARRRRRAAAAPRARRSRAAPPRRQREPAVQREDEQAAPASSRARSPARQARLCHGAPAGDAGPAAGREPRRHHRRRHLRRDRPDRRDRRARHRPLVLQSRQLAGRGQRLQVPADRLRLEVRPVVGASVRAEADQPGRARDRRLAVALRRAERDHVS